MPKKQRLSWMYEGPPAGRHPTIEEDVLADSPVEVEYPSAECDCTVNEPPTAFAYEEAPVEESAADIAAEEAPVEEQAADVATEEPLRHSTIEEPQTDHQHDSLYQSNDPIESNNQGSEITRPRGVEEINNDLGEVIIVCTSCTTMLFIEYDDTCPYDMIRSIGSEYQCYSWLLHTTCLSCANKLKESWGSRDTFSKQCVTGFNSAILSEEFMNHSRWFKTANSICKRPTKIVMNGKGNSIAYVKADDLREQTTKKCRIRGLRYVGLTDASRKLGILESFMPGGFM